MSLVKILPREEKVVYPVCIDGALACPPEDCGSLPGYYACIKTARTRDDEELLEWLGEWTPDTFDPQAVKFERPWERMKKALEG